MEFNWSLNRSGTKEFIPSVCGKVECVKSLTKDDATVACIGTCRKVFHASCIGIEKNDVALLKKYKSMNYRCEKCSTFECSVVEMFRSIESKIGIINAKMSAHKSSTTTELSERISRIEGVIEKSGQSVVHGMSQIVEQVSKVVVDKSSEVEKKIENAQEFGKWIKVENKKKKKKKDSVVVIKPKDVMKSRGELKKSLRTSIDSSHLKINGMNDIAQNGVVLRCDDDDMCEKIIDEVKTKFGDDVEVRKPIMTKPRIKMLRVNDPDSDDEQLIEKLKSDNEMIAESEIVVIRREQVKRFGKECDGVFNIVMQINNEAYEKIMVDKKLKYHFQRYSVVDNIYIRRCYKCWGFNHNASVCRNEIACSKCAESHKFNECRSNNKKCINCSKCNERAGTNHATNHDVWSPECSMYKVKLMRSKRGLSHIQ